MEVITSVKVLTMVLTLCFGQSAASTCGSAGLSAGCCTGSSCGVGTCFCDEVCHTVYNDCCRDVPQQLNCNAIIRPALFQAIMTIESRGDINAVGSGGRAIGPFQIHRSYWIDAIEYDPSLTANGQTYQNCMGPGSIEYSKRVMQAYMNRYASAARLGRSPTDEDIARIHNGGPNGYRKSSTVGYWNKVRAHLQYLDNGF